MRAVLLISMLCVSSPVQAEIVRTAMPCGEPQRVCAYWWPKLKDISGWAQDMRHSFRYGANAQAPEGHTFADAETVIYARAEYKARVPQITSLQQFIEQDKSKFLTREPDLSVSQLAPRTDEAGRRYVVYNFKPKDKGNWEQAAYSEEKDGDGNEYYLVFVLSSRTEDGYKNSIGAFHQFIATYE